MQIIEDGSIQYRFYTKEYFRPQIFPILAFKIF